MVATSVDGATPPSERQVLALGEAKSGETMGKSHLRTLEMARGSLGVRASGAKLLLFARAFASDLKAAAGERADVELVDLHRLYTGT